MLTKKEARAQAKQWRHAITKEQYAEISARITQRIIAEFPLEDFDEYLFYYPLPGEVSLLPLCDQLISVGKKAAFPRVHGDEMDFYRVTDLDADFKEGAFHVMEPVTEEYAKTERAACFVPGLLFDISLCRMGYGRGYYDKYFAKHDGICRVGICPDRFFVPEIPKDAYDKAMDMVITQTRIYAQPHQRF